MQEHKEALSMLRNARTYMEELIADCQALTLSSQGTKVELDEARRELQLTKEELAGVKDKLRLTTVDLGVATQKLHSRQFSPSPPRR